MAKVKWTIPAQTVRKKFYLQGMRDFGTSVANKTDEDTRRSPENLTRKIEKLKN